MIHRSFAAILTDLADLLDRNEGPHRAFVRSIVETEDEGDLNHWDIWGGQGSVADFAPMEPEQNRLLMETIVELEDAMGTMRLSSPRARQTAQLMEDWLITHPEYGQRGTTGDA